MTPGVRRKNREGTDTGRQLPCTQNESPFLLVPATGPETVLPQGERPQGERKAFQSMSTERMSGGCQKESRRTWGKDEEAKERDKGENERKKKCKKHEGERGKADKQFSGAFLFFKGCQHVYAMLSFPLPIHWALHTKEQEGDHARAAGDSLRRRTEVPWEKGNRLVIRVQWATVRVCRPGKSKERKNLQRETSSRGDHPQDLQAVQVSEKRESNGMRMQLTD